MANCRNYLGLSWLYIYLIFTAVIATKKDGYHNLNYTQVYENNSSCNPVKYDCDHLRNRNVCFVNGTEYDIDEIFRQADTNRCENSCVCTNETDNLEIPLEKPRRIRGMIEMEVALRQEGENGKVDCCPVIEEMVQPIGGRNRNGMYVELYQTTKTAQRFFEYSCRPDIVDKPCRCTGRKFNNQSKCVQKYSYVYAIVKNSESESHDNITSLSGVNLQLDYIQARSGCGCEIERRKKKKKKKKQDM